MPDIGSLVIYGSNGICRITDKRKEKLYGAKNEYYVLTPVDNAGAMILVPADNEALLAKMKNILSENDIISLIKSIDDNELWWINDSKKRNELFSVILENGDRTELLRLIKCIYLKRKELSSAGKKLWLSDENTLKKAEKIINAEFSMVLGISPEEVPQFIEGIINA